MDPVTAAGLALGVAGVAFQVYSGCVQGIQLLITAKNFPDEYGYLNLRLRMEQQRLFAWSETSGLADVDGKSQQKILESNTFILHRTTVLDLLVQIQCLFKEFQDRQKEFRRLQVVNESDSALESPERDASEAKLVLSERRRDFIKNAMLKLKDKSAEGVLRLKWASFRKEDFEALLAKFAALNDSMTDLLDARLQVEIHQAVQDTNRGMLQLHHKIADLSRLVMALDVRLGSTTTPVGLPMSTTQREARTKDAYGLRSLSELAKFKAFNETIESGMPGLLDETTTMCLELGRPGERKNLMLEASVIDLCSGDVVSQRCEAYIKCPNGTRKRVWIEWKEYDRQIRVPPKGVILERVKKLVALLNHSPKPEAFRTPHCLGFFDQAEADDENSDDDDVSHQRLGLVFERPEDDKLHTEMPPVSLRELLERDPAIYNRPSVTDRAQLALAVANCLLSLHLANWLHKSLRSENVIFFRTADGHIDYGKPYISGFDFSRPARKEEMTEIAGDDVGHNLYRHPMAQTTASPGERSRFKKSFDIYSLGVVLVEIAHWATVDNVLGLDLAKARGRPSMITQVQEKLLDRRMQAQLGGHMGDRYEKATYRCIKGGKWLNLMPGDEVNDEVAPRLSMEFYQQVIKRLESIVT